MSEDQSPVSAPGTPVSETPEPAQRTRRISTPRPKKTAAKTAAKSAEKPAEKNEEKPADKATEKPVEVTVEPVAPKKELPPQEPAAAPPAEASGDAPTASTVTETQASQDWPEAETISDGSGKNGNDKRKRRRKKGKGGQNAQQPAPQAEEAGPVGENSAATAKVNEAAPGNPPGPRPHQQNPQHHRQPVNPEQLAKRAWKIFLAEVSEEGVSLIGDQDARELSKRCFRLAEIFLDEQARRLR